MEASIALDTTEPAGESQEAIRPRPGKVVPLPVAHIGPARDGEPRLDVDGEAFQLARVRGGDGAAAAVLRVPALPPIALPRVAWGELLRRAFDIVAASLLLIALAPLLLLIALAIRLDSPGPALFRQRRLGRRTAPFTINKFRTMYEDADARVHEEYMRRQLTNGDHAAVNRDGREIFKPWPDSRITRVGAVLRRWSLDELPQLINVVRGEMSIVGFRPPIEYEVECYPDWYYRRFAVKPGITGIWQVSGRNEKSYEEMVRYDIQYVDTRSWRLDLVLLLKTFGAVLRRRGAY